MIVAWLASMLLHAMLNIHRSASLLVTPSGLKWALAFQGNISLHDAAISELIFELLESQQWIETASEHTRSKSCCVLRKRFKLKSSVRKGLRVHWNEILTFFVKSINFVFTLKEYYYASRCSLKNYIDLRSLEHLFWQPVLNPCML